MREQEHVADALATLAGALESLELGPDASEWSADRARLVGTIRSYLIPRTENPAAPMTVVVAGPTGSGKSTLVNSLTGLDVSPTGVLRPTTRQPIVLAGAESAERYRSVGGVDCHVIPVQAPLLESVVLVDTPDIDSTSTSHRTVAETLVDNADVVVFVTSALRYADEVPWQVLRRAVSRGAPVIHALNRVGSESAGAVVDFRSRLTAAGLDDDLVVVPEHHLAAHAQHVPTVAVQSLRRRLAAVVANRDEFAVQVFDRVLRSTISQVTDLIRAMTQFGEETDDFAAHLSLGLADRISALDFGDVAEGLAMPPTGGSRWAESRWKRRARQVDAKTTEAQLAKLVERVVSAIHADLRQWLVGERRELHRRNLDPADLVPEMVGMAQSNIEGWVWFVERIAADHDPRDLWLAQSTLIEAATTSSESVAVPLLFGDDGEVLVDRARRELWGRVEFVYSGAVDLLVEAIRRRQGHLDDEDELRTALGAVTSTLAPAYA